MTAPTGDRSLPGPLSDLRVLEMGQLVAGPFCAQLLGDFGAEIIKLEDPGKGDPLRVWGREKPYGMSLWWPIVGRNKKSVTCDLRSEAGQELARQIASHCDVLLENFRPGALERWHLSPDELWEINPRLIIVRISGYGQTGPYSARAGFGSIGEAMGGIRHVTGEPDRPSSRSGISLGDELAGLFATVGTMAAVHARETTGRGQIVDSAIYESVLAMMESLLPEWELGASQRERTGAILPNIAPSNAYRTADDDDIIMGANNDSVFIRLAEAMGRPELASDPRYATHAGRGLNQAELDTLIDSWTRTIPSGQLLTILHEHGVPAGRIYRARDMFEDPQFAARQAIIWKMHPTLGNFPMQSVFPKLSDTPGEVRWLGPELGEHNKEIYGGLLGLSDEEIAEHHAAGVI